MPGCTTASALGSQRYWSVPLTAQPQLDATHSPPRIRPMRLFPLLLCLVPLAAHAAEPTARWWKGNLHTHSLWSDGDEYPEVITEWSNVRARVTSSKPKELPTHPGECEQAWTQPLVIGVK